MTEGEPIAAIDSYDSYLALRDLTRQIMGLYSHLRAQRGAATPMADEVAALRETAVRLVGRMGMTYLLNASRGGPDEEGVLSGAIGLAQAYADVQTAWNDFADGTERLAAAWAAEHRWAECEEIAGWIAAIDPPRAARLRRTTTLGRAQWLISSGEFAAVRMHLAPLLSLGDPDAAMLESHSLHRQAADAIQREAWLEAAGIVRELTKNGSLHPDISASLAQHPWLAWATGPVAPARALLGRTDRVQSVAFSPNAWLAIGTAQNGVKIWDSAQSRLVQELEEDIDLLAFSPDSRRLACGDATTIVVYDTRSWEVIHRFDLQKLTRREDSYLGYSIIFAPDGAILALEVGGGSYHFHPGPVSLWNVTTGTLVRSFERPGGRMTVAALSPDGQLLAEAREDDGIAVWAVRSGQKLHTFHTQEGNPPWALAFSNDRRYLLSSGALVETAVIWDIARREAVNELKGQSPNPGYQGACFGQDPRIALAWDGNRAELWLTEEEKVLVTIRDDEIGSDGVAALSPDGWSLVVAGNWIIGGNGARLYRPRSAPPSGPQ